MIGALIANCSTLRKLDVEEIILECEHYLHLAQALVRHYRRQLSENEASRENLVDEEL